MKPQRVKPQRIKLQPGQESVWDYPRPPRLEASDKHIRVVFNGQTIADTTNAKRLLETSHPPVYYLPQSGVRMDYFSPTTRSTVCEFKGRARYWTVTVAGKASRDVAWSYPEPVAGFEAIKDHIALYPGKMDACYVDDEQVRAQEGDFYGGWVTADIVGPFKGGSGTWGW